MTNSVLCKDVKERKKKRKEKEEFNRKYSGFILLFSVHLHISLIFVLTIGSNCKKFCPNWQWVLAVCFFYVEFC